MKFFTLFRKELKEMLTLQTVLVMVIMVVVLSMAGQGLSQAVEESTETMMDINLCDLDNTEFSQSVVKFMTANLQQYDGDVHIVDIQSEDYAAELERLDIKSVLIIPKGFTEAVENNQTAEVGFVQRMTSLSTFSNLNTGSQVAVEYLSAAVKDVVYNVKVSTGKLTQAEVSFINNPLTVNETTVVGDKSESISSQIVMSLCSAQGMIVPILMFVLVVMASNMMITAVSTEKIDKTLETLLSSPISRLSVITAKMLAAACVAAMQAAVYMFGINNMMNGIMENIGGTDGYGEVLKNLGLTLGLKQYVMVGVQMFLSILITLSVSLVLGVLAQDAKSAQSLMLPIQAATMVPYMLTMFMDVNTLSPALRLVVNAIPFTHAFTASENAMFGNISTYVGGLIYQVVFLIICLVIALRIFMSDRIFTMSLGGKKSKGVVNN